LVTETPERGEEERIPEKGGAFVDICIFEVLVPAPGTVAEKTNVYVPPGTNENGLITRKCEFLEPL